MMNIAFLMGSSIATAAEASTATFILESICNALNWRTSAMEHPTVATGRTK